MLPFTALSMLAKFEVSAVLVICGEAAAGEADKRGVVEQPRLIPPEKGAYPAAGSGSLPAGARTC